MGVGMSEYNIEDSVLLIAHIMYWLNVNISCKTNELAIGENLYSHQKIKCVD